MGVVRVVPPFEVFPDVDGDPLENGYIYVGQAGLNPEILANQLDAYWDVALTIPATQPIRTLNGFPSKDGAPANFYVGANAYSIVVRNKNSSLVYTNLSVVINSVNFSSDLLCRTVSDMTSDNILLVDGSTITSDEAESVADTGVRLQTTWNNSTSKLGAGTYELKTLVQHRLDIADPTWVPDGFGDHYLFNQTAFVAVLQAVIPIDPAVFGALLDGSDDSSVVQACLDRYFEVDFGGSSRTYVLDNPIGLPDNDIRSDKFITLIGSGAKIKTDSSEAIITSKVSLPTPDSTDNLFTGSIIVNGISFSGKTTNAKTANIFNGDRLYNVLVTKCSFDDLNYIAYSFRQKGSNIVFSEGYFQSFFIDVGNRIHDVNRIFKGSKGMNISLSQNFLEGDIRLAVDIQSDFGATSVDSLRIISNVYEGGGMLFNLGAVFGCEISSNYMEANDRYTALTEHALGVFDSTVASGGLSIHNNFLLANDTTDVSYATFKWKNYTPSSTSYVNYWKGCSIENNFCNNQQLVDGSCPLRYVNNNSVPSNVVTNRPKHFIDSAIDAFNFTTSRINTSGVGTGTQEIFKFRFTNTKDDELNRNFHVKVKMRISHISDVYPALPAGAYQVGADYFEFDVLFFYREGFGGADIGMSASGAITQHIPAVGSAGGGATYAAFFTSPTLVLTPSGDDFIVSISGYANQSDGFASAARLKAQGVVIGECAYRNNISIDDVRAINV